MKKPNILDNPYLYLSDQFKEQGGIEIRKTRLVSPYDFIFRYTYTLDPHDPDNPIKLIPDHEYIRQLIKIWLEERMLLIVKSRQMMATWLFCALNLWLALNQRGQYIFFVSKKEDDAGFSSSLSLLSRVFFIYEHLPKDMQIPFRKSLVPSMLVFPDNNSTIHGVSQDSDAVRQYTTSSMFSDEMAFQERSEMSFAAIKPTLDGHRVKIKLEGDTFLTLPKFAGVSTPNGKRNLFYKLVYNLNE